MNKTLYHILLLLFLLILIFKWTSLGPDWLRPQEKPEDVSLTIFAAASLSEAIPTLTQAYQQEKPEISFQYHFAGSQQVRTQIEYGAQTDLAFFASAKDAQYLSDVGLTQYTSSFAFNELVIIVPKDNPKNISTAQDLEKPHQLILADTAVPAGRYSEQLLENLNSEYGPNYANKVLNNVISRETNVRLVVSKISLNEADAGIVYRTDTNTTVQVIEIPDQHNILAEYQLVLPIDTKNQREAREFADFVLSDKGQDILRSLGFLPLKGE